jgi:hypothetical protein
MPFVGKFLLTKLEPFSLHYRHANNGTPETVILGVDIELALPHLEVGLLKLTNVSLCISWRAKEYPGTGGKVLWSFGARQLSWSIASRKGHIK